MDGMIERSRDQVVTLGGNKIGIVTQPVPQVPTDRPGIVILNTGITHRVGHHRMYVDLSRQLAASGHTVLRFDLSGIGDSPPRADGLSPLDACIADIGEALDWLSARRGIGRVILVGLCAGADQSIVYAGGDRRVVGAILLDPSIPATPRFYVIRATRSVIRPGAWRRLFSRGIRLLNHPRHKAGGAEAWRPPTLNDPAVRSFLEARYQAAVAQGVQLLAITTSGVLHQHNHRRQLAAAFRRISFGDQLRLEYFRRCDHTFTLEANRERLFASITDWLQDTHFRMPDHAA